MIPKFLKSSWGIIRGFRPFNLGLILGLHKAAQWVLFRDNYGLMSLANRAELQHNLDLLMWASFALAAAGYLINDFYDLKTDQINKPEKSPSAIIRNKSLFWSLWGGLNLLAFLIGLSLDKTLEQTQFRFLFIGISGVLWAYNLSKWSKFFIGPLLISVLVVLNLILVLEVFSFLPLSLSIEAFSAVEIKRNILEITPWFWRIAFLGFLTNFIREIVKDIEDINGDQNAGRQTIPIVIGIERTAKLAAALGVILVLSLGAFMALSLSLSIALSINLALVLTFALWITYNCTKIERPSQAKSLSLSLKLLLSLGLVCLIWL
jgi:4-hydroxybenzoate polyprenyltransferase